MPARFPRPRSREAVVLFVAVNVLNLLDAGATHFVVSRGLAVEGNPVVRGIGFSGKIVLVLAASWLLAGIRPRALLVPVLGLAAVVVWTLAGVLWVTPAA